MKWNHLYIFDNLQELFDKRERIWNSNTFSIHKYMIFEITKILESRYSVTKYPFLTK